MFTGIVEDLGVVASRAATRLAVRTDLAARDATIGGSLAVNGVCLTVVGIDGDVLAFDLSEETLARTALSRLGEGDPVNLERPATLLSRLGGHLVQGHVDGVGDVTEVVPDPAGGVRMRVRLPDDLLRFVVEKGSIAFDGVSLTVAGVAGAVVEVALIPHTLAATTLGTSSAGDPLHVEVDVIAKHVAAAVEHLLSGGGDGSGDGGTWAGARAERTGS
jgi:riboflavin synthase